MADLDYGQVEVELTDRTYTLKATISAMQKIDRQFGSIRQAIDACGSLSFNAIVSIIVSGAGIGQKHVKEVETEVFSTGITHAAAPVMEYLMVLLNPSGRDASEDADEGEG